VRILFLTNGYPPLHTAGTEISTEAVATSLARSGHAVFVGCVGRWDEGDHPLNGLDEDEQDGVAVTRFDLNWRRGGDPNRALFDNPATARAVGALVDRVAPDVVHVTSCYTLSASVMREVKARGLPLVVTLTDFWFLCPRVMLLRSNGTPCTGRTTAADCLDCMLSDSAAYVKVRRMAPAGLLAAATGVVARQPRLSRSHGFLGRAQNFAVRKPLLLDLLRSADAILAPTRSLAARHTELGLEREIRLWRYGHELGWAAAVERRPPDGRLVFGFVGRVAPEKGVHVLLDAASRLDPGAGGAAVEVWGDAAQEPGYLARCRALPTTGLAVDFRGRFTRDRLAEVYGHIDVLVVPSTWNENDPLVVHEAFAAGVPVIASDVGGLREVVTAESDGLLFRAGDAGDLAAAMARFVTDPTLVSRLRAGIGLVRTSSEAAADLAALYAGLVEGLAG